MAEKSTRKRKVAAIRLAGPGITRKTATRVLDALDGAASGVTPEGSVMTRLRSRAGRPVVVSVDLPAVDGTVVPLWLGSLCAQLQLNCEALPVFAELLHAAVQACGRRGLTGVLYFDDVTPGNIIRPDNARKCTTAYFSLAELGGAFRSVHGWLHVALIRRDEVKQVVGGMARVLASIAEFVQQEMHTCSVYLAASSTGPATVDVRLRTVFLVADEDGLRAGLAVKGSSGLKPCFRCQNCVALQHSSLAGFFAIDHANFSDFQPHTNGSLEETLACLRRVQDRPALLAEAELLAGWYLRDDTLLGRADLRNFIPVQHCFFDPMHCHYSCGLIACEAGLFLAKCRELIGLRQEHIDRLGGTGFQQPQQQGRPKQVLHASLLKLTSQDYKGNAGQCKLLLPLLAYLASDVLGPGVENETRSLLALHRCCPLLEALKCRPSESLLQELEVWQARHLEYFVEAHSRERVRPKHHYSRHVPSQIRTAGFVFDTWTTERKHRRLKLDVAPHQKRLDRFSRDSLASLIEQDFVDVSLLAAKPTLQKPELEKHLCLQWPGRVVLWSNSLEVEGRKLDSGMYLLDRYQVAVQVLRFLQLDDTAHMAVIQPLQPLVRNAHWSRWQPDTGKKEQLRLLQELLHAQRPSWQLQENNGWLLLH